MKLQIFLTFTLLPNLVPSVRAHDHDHDQAPLEYVKFPQPIYRGIGEGKLFGPLSHFVKEFDPFFNSSVTADAIFSGITTFARLPWVQCLTKEQHTPFDIAFLGAPFVSPESNCCRITQKLLLTEVRRILAPVTDQVLDSAQVGTLSYWLD